MSTAPFRYLVAPVALCAAALVFAGVAATPPAERAALSVWRAGISPTELIAGPLAGREPGALSYLKASNADAADAFGSSVALSRDGRTLVVGADLEAGDAQRPDGQPGSGAVYVFSRTDTGWVQQAYLKAAQPEAGAAFGLSVALSDDGDTLVVGAPFEAHAQGDGAVHVFRRAFGEWRAQDRLLPAAGGEAGLFGSRVAIAGNGSAIAVAARAGDAAQARGSVHLFAPRAGRWVPASRVEAARPGAGDGFGQSLAFAADGRTLAVGARPADTPAVGARSGAVRLFAWQDTGWVAAGELQAAEPQAGRAVTTEVALSADGRRLVVGASSAAGGAAQVRVFDRLQGGWQPSATLQSAGVPWGFGERLALSADGRRLAVSAMYEPLSAGTGAAQPEAGAVYLFEQRTERWTQTERLNAARGRSGDLFGSALSMSADGRWLATGARLEDGGARGIDAALPATPAANSGAVYVYAPV